MSTVISSGTVTRRESPTVSRRVVRHTVAIAPQKATQAAPAECREPEYGIALLFRTLFGLAVLASMALMLWQLSAALYASLYAFTPEAFLQAFSGSN